MPKKNFNCYVILILNHVYDETPSATFFNLDVFSKLTGYGRDQEEECDCFFETIDYLAREGYLKCASDCIRLSYNAPKIISPNIPVYISELGKNKLELQNGNENTSFSVSVKNYASNIIGKVGEKVIENTTVLGIDKLLHTFFSMKLYFS